MKCPECQKNVSIKARICPYCRTDLYNHSGWQHAVRKEQRMSHLTGLLCLAIAIGVFWYFRLDIFFCQNLSYSYAKIGQVEEARGIIVDLLIKTILFHRFQIGTT
jgi:hypothetical protein